MEVAAFYQLKDVRAGTDVPRSGHAHLVGIAGSGMRAMADVLAGWGWEVSGSDCCLGDLPAATAGLSHSACGRPIAASSLRLFPMHAAENLPDDAGVVIYSDAIPPTNPERRRAVELGIPTLSYFEAVGRISADRHTVAIAGTHGKSTVTAMLAHVLIRAGRDPTVFCGATPLGATSGGRAGRDTILLAEACEYRRNFLHLRPRQAAILGVEADHFDCYDALEQTEEAFQRFAQLLPADGVLLANCHCDSTRRVSTDVACKVESFGFEATADWSAKPLSEGRGCFTFTVLHARRPLCDVRLQVPGRHNMANALAAAAMAWHNGATTEAIATGLNDFAGVRRRLEVLETRRGIARVDDYAHHPTEIRAALATIRRMFPGRRLWCVFQPHQACRTARLLDAFAVSLQNADKVLVADIFRAREGPWQPGEVTAADLARRTGELGAAVVAGHSTEEIAAALQTHLAPGDVLVTLGAGDVAKFLSLVDGPEPRPVDVDNRQADFCVRCTHTARKERV